MRSTTAGHRLVVAFAFIMPVAGVAAPKTFTVLVVIAGLAGLVQWARAGRPPLPLNKPFAVALAALGVWAAVTAIWAPAPAAALILVGSLAVIAVAGSGLLFFVSRLDETRRHAAENAFLIGTAAGLVIVAIAAVYAKMTGRSLWGTFKFDPLTTLNNSAVAISLIAWPAFVVLWRRGRRIAAGVGAAAIYSGLLFLSSGAALLGPLAGLAGFLIVRLAGRKGALALAAVVAGVALAAPAVISVATLAEKAGKVATSMPSSAEHRIEIWSFVIGKIEQKPIRGWGMDASRAIPGGHRHLAPEVEILPLHPHNGFLQVRLELGLPGAVIVAAVLGILFAQVIGAIEDRAARAFAAGAACAYLAVASVSYGVWQNWWVAVAWALAALMAAALRPASPG